jgi:hypothetical protein
MGSVDCQHKAFVCFAAVKIFDAVQIHGDFGSQNLLLGFPTTLQYVRHVWTLCVI